MPEEYIRSELQNDGGEKIKSNPNQSPDFGHVAPDRIRDYLRVAPGRDPGPLFGHPKSC